MILANKKGTERFKNLWKESLKTPNGPIMERNIYLQYIVTENYIWELYILLPRFLGWHIFHMAQPSNKLTMKNPRIFGESKTFWTPPKELRKQKQVLSFKASTATSRSLNLWLVRCLGSNVFFFKLNMKCFLDTLQPQVIPDTGFLHPHMFRTEGGFWCTSQMLMSRMPRAFLGKRGKLGDLFEVVMSLTCCFFAACHKWFQSCDYLE